jgi:hypothetical protein
MSRLRSRGSLATSLVAVLCLGLSAAGCGTEIASEDDTPPGSPGAAVEGRESVLAELDVGYGVIRFHELTSPDGTRSLAMSETAPAGLKTTPLDSLLRQGRLTSLEIFQAIAPDLPVPPAIANAHPFEAAALGRTSEAVRQARFDKNAPAAMSVASCESFVYQDPGDYDDWHHKLGRTSVSGSWWLNVGTAVDNWSYSTVGSVTLGVCNDSNVAISGRIAHDDTEDSTGWIYWGIVTVNPGYAWRWWNFSKSRFDCPPSPPDDFCFDYVPIRYGVWGSSSSGKPFHLRTAELGAETCTTSLDCPYNYACGLDGLCYFVPR